MLRTILCLLIAAPTLFAQTGASKSDMFRKEGPALQRAVDQAISEVPGISLLQTSKATYIQEFGIVVSLEVALEPPRGPFDVAQPANSSLPQKQQRVRDRMKQLLAQKAPELQTAANDQFVVIVVHLFNSNPVDTPKLPQQMIIMVKKGEPSAVILREL